MANDSQPRMDDGTFGVKPQSAPEVQLAEEVDGSFLFPPSEWPGGAEQYLRFWRTQPISDEALTNFTTAYAAEWDLWGQPKVDAFLFTWGNSEEARQLRNSGATAAQLDAAREAAGQRFIQEKLDPSRPKRIDNGLVRHVARAAQIMQNANRLPTDADREAVGEAVMYSNRSGVPWTAAEIWEAYQLEDIMPDAFYASDYGIHRQLRELTENIRRS